ncbi:hypothetical protein CYR83_02970 [Ligilactobacillus agilis]|uniref:Uncharacterized protein n=1 Tax=Ligilactobacillus agilis TaxID=1601 RepID=A0A2I2A938_9LACO|nr:hypothetical protein [Ligilactobacillus agilis]PLA75899.1 hypothetical protein CYR79_09035 [Ligilactobacillus agilis]PLA83559.1 hypothetical protein CYR83_02970 [Ligilactobacillus agilis]
MEDKNINVNISKNRRRYSISPTNLLFRVLDRNADLSEIKFWDFKKQLTFRVLLTWMAVIVLAIGLFSKTFIGRGGIWSFVFAVTYIWAVYICCSRTPTGDFKFSYIKPLFSYYREENKIISTRSVAKVYPVEKLYNLVGDQDFENGLIRFKDGDVGELAEITGLASRLMFEEDQDMVVRDTVAFYKTLSDKVILIFDTVLSPQRVTNQVNYKQEQIKRLNSLYKNTELKDLLEREKKILNDKVGNRFVTIRQYMIIKSASLEEVRRVEGVLGNQIYNTSYLKNGRIIDSPREIKEYFKDLFGGYRE